MFFEETWKSAFKIVRLDGDPFIGIIVENVLRL